MIFISAVDGDEWLHEGEPVYPTHHGMEILRVIFRDKAAGVSRLITDPACPDEVKQKAAAWLARHGVDVRVKRAV